MPLFATGSGREGIVHVIGPELGVTQPGMTIVCGDSHTVTHGAFGALAFGIGTSEVEHVLATQTLQQTLPKTMQVRLRRRPAVRALREGSRARRDRAAGRRRRPGPRARVHRPGDRGALDGRADDGLQHVDRGGRAGRDDRARRHDVRLSRGPAGCAERRGLGAGARAVAAASHRSRRVVRRRGHGRARPVEAAGHVGHEPRHGRRRSTVSSRTPRTTPTRTSATPSSARSATWIWRPGTPLVDVRIDKVFIGSCTNARIEDLRTAATVVAGRRVADGVQAIVVPGSAQVKRQAEAEGLNEIFEAAGFEWRRAGCSMCLGMNPDILAAGRAVRVDVEPQLRGPAGRGRPHASRQPGDGGGSGGQRPLHRRPGARMRALRSVTGSVAILDRPDVDTDQIIPKQFLKRIERSGYGQFLFFDWMKDPAFELHAYPGRVDPAHRTQLRLRLVARARGVGARRLRVQGRDRAVVRRHLPHERDQDRARADRPAGGGRRTAPRSASARATS